MNAVWSYLLAAVGILGIWMAGRKSWVGWAIGCGAQLLWVAYALVTAQYGFIISALAYAAVYANNWRKWTVAGVETVVWEPRWEPTRWWRTVDTEDTLWCESSDEFEVRRSALHSPDLRVQRLYQTVAEEEWRDEQG